MAVTDAIGTGRTAGTGNPAADHNLVAAQLNALMAQRRLPLGLEAAYRDVYVPDGVTPIAIRCDDGPLSDYSLTLGKLRARGLVAGFALIGKHVNPSDPTYDNNPSGFLQPSQALELQHAGMELMNHSRGHGNSAPADSALYDEIVQNGADLRALGFNIDSFVRPGPWDGVLDTAAKWDAPSGHAVRATHVAAESYIANGWPNKIKTFPVWTPYGTEPSAQTLLADVTAAYEQARAYGGSLTLLYHTGGFGADGSASWLNFDSVLDFIAAERDAGRALPMTPTGLNRAQRGARINLCPDPSFEAYAADSADSPWSGSHTAGTGRLSGSSLQIASNSSNLTIGHGDGLRTLDITGYAKAAGSNASARISTVQKLGATTLDTHTTTVPVTSAGWTFWRKYMRIDPRAAYQGVGAASTGTIQIQLAQSTATVLFDDLTIAKC